MWVFIEEHYKKEVPTSIVKVSIPNSKVIIVQGLQGEKNTLDIFLRDKFKWTLYQKMTYPTDVLNRMKKTSVIKSTIHIFDLENSSIKTIEISKP